MAARGREPTDVPGVKDLHLRTREVDDHNLGPPGWGRTGFRGPVFMDVAKGQIPGAVPAAAGIGPTAGDAIAPGTGYGPAAGEGRPRHDRPCAVPIDRLGRLIAQKRRRDRGTAIDEEAPPGGAIYPSDGLHDLIERQRINLQPAQRPWHEHVVEPGVVERLHDGVREMTLPLPAVGVLVNHGRELLDTCEQALPGDGVCHTKPSLLVRVYQELPKHLGLLSLPNAHPSGERLQPPPLAPARQKPEGKPRLTLVLSRLQVTSLPGEAPGRWPREGQSSRSTRYTRRSSRHGERRTWLGRTRSAPPPAEI